MKGFACQEMHFFCFLFLACVRSTSQVDRGKDTTWYSENYRIDPYGYQQRPIMKNYLQTKADNKDMHASVNIQVVCVCVCMCACMRMCVGVCVDK